MKGSENLFPFPNLALFEKRRGGLSNTYRKYLWINHKILAYKRDYPFSEKYTFLLELAHNKYTHTSSPHKKWKKAFIHRYNVKSLKMLFFLFCCYAFIANTEQKFSHFYCSLKFFVGFTFFAAVSLPHCCFPFMIFV
jgi:hypothetical protein